jgi:hypothetical protein
MKRALMSLALCGGLVLCVGTTSGGGGLVSAQDDLFPARTGEQEFHRNADRTLLEAPGDVPEGIAGGYVFVPITPYRTLDSRNDPSGPVIGGTDGWFTVLVDENNNPMIPNTAVAVTYNLTVVETFGAGFCALFPATMLWPGNSSINWTATNQTVANGGTVAIANFDGDGQVAIYCGPQANVYTHFILDITGYYI